MHVQWQILLVFALIAAGIRGAWCKESPARDWPFFTPVVRESPEVDDDEWVRNDIDRFVWQKLRANNLSPAAAASNVTLVRRLYFDLIGLPPTPEEIDLFLADSSDDAYERLVDRLLDDSRYGERWARYWLDLARYADTAGYEGDPDLPHAWRYRDYVIDAFNSDKPYDLFIREQLAGDEFDEIMGAGELPETSPERKVALTFLRLAPFTEPRGNETRHEMLSEMTSTVGSVFLGLTVGCAKCHDHKHDEISIADFYRMKAFFSTIQIPPPERGDAYQIGGPTPAEFYRDGEKEWADSLRKRLESEAGSADAALSQLKREIAKRIGDRSLTGSGFAVQAITAAGNDYAYDRTIVHDGDVHCAIVSSTGNEWTISTDGIDPRKDIGLLAGRNRGRWFGNIANPSFISLGQHTAGTGKPTGNDHVGSFSEILIYDHALASAEHSRLAEYLHKKYGVGVEHPANRKSNSPPTKGLQFWLDASDLDADTETPNPADGTPIYQWIDRVGGIRLRQPVEKLQPKLMSVGVSNSPAVQFSEDFLIASEHSQAPFLRDHQGTLVVVFTATHGHEGYGFEVGGDGEFVSTVIHPGIDTADPIDQLIASGDTRISTEERRRIEYLSSRAKFVKQHLKRLKPAAMSLRHSFGPPYEPGVPTSRIMNRGEYDNPGEVVSPGFLSVITGNEEPAKIRLDPFKRWPTRSRRMALANWIASAENPMTARVMANRLWHWHFGQGIVRTTSDFGYLSGGPSHQELLDWLAVKFVQNKWSIKAMHRLIVNSATYRQRSNVVSPKADEIDPDNRLLWRFNRKRLDAEAIRDSVLAVSGRLNSEQFGLPIFPPLPGDVAETVKYGDSKWDTQYGPEGRKRSIYVYQQRTLTMPLMQTFDSLVCEESRPMRRVSVTPLQALAMYNGEFVNDEASYFAKRVRAQAGADRSNQIELAFRLAFARRPTVAESERMARLMAQSSSELDGLTSACRVLYNANEFLYVD